MEYEIPAAAGIMWSEILIETFVESIAALCSFHILRFVTKIPSSLRYREHTIPVVTGIIGGHVKQAIIN